MKSLINKVQVKKIADNCEKVGDQCLEQYKDSKKIEAAKDFRCIEIPFDVYDSILKTYKNEACDHDIKVVSKFMVENGLGIIEK